MHVKYFQYIANIKSHYEDILRNFEPENSRFGSMLSRTWGIAMDEKEQIEEEIEVLRYLLACRLNFSRNSNVKKPSIELVNRCFNRHLYFLEKVHKCDQWNVNKHHSQNIIKQYKACRHYLFKFSLPGWVRTLPDEILTIENRYKQRAEEKEADLPIPKIQ